MPRQLWLLPDDKSREHKPQSLSVINHRQMVIVIVSMKQEIIVGKPPLASWKSGQLVSLDLLALEPRGWHLLLRHLLLRHFLLQHFPLLPVILPALDLSRLFVPAALPCWPLLPVFPPPVLPLSAPPAVPLPALPVLLSRFACFFCLTRLSAKFFLLVAGIFPSAGACRTSRGPYLHVIYIHRHVIPHHGVFMAGFILQNDSVDAPEVLRNPVFLSCEYS